MASFPLPFLLSKPSYIPLLFSFKSMKSFANLIVVICIYVCVYVCIVYVCMYLKYNLLILNKVTHMYVFRAVYLALDNQLL